MKPVTDIPNTVDASWQMTNAECEVLPEKLPNCLDAMGNWIGQDSTQAAKAYIEESNLRQSGE